MHNLFLLATPEHYFPLAIANAPSQRAFTLIACEHHGVPLIIRQMLKVLNARPSDQHAGRAHNHARAVLMYNLHALFLAADFLEAGKQEWIVIFMEDLLAHVRV